MAVAPTLVNTYSTAYDTAVKPKTVSVTTQAGDVVIVAAAMENGSTTFTTPTGNGITFTQKILSTDNSPAASTTAIWTGTDSAGGTNWTLSVSNNGNLVFGATCYVFRYSNGIGNANSNNLSVGTGTATLTLVTNQANSAVVVMDADWTGGSSVPSHTWATVNGITPTAGNGEILTFASSNYVVYTGFYSDSGAAGVKTVGLTSPLQRYALVAIEVYGGSGPPVTSATTAWLRA